MQESSFDHGFGTVWKDVYVHRREGYYTSVSDFHRHEFYELNLILSGNVNILLGDRAEQGRGYHLVLTQPGVPHYISCKPDTLYSRLYLAFSTDFVSTIPEWVQLCSAFGEQGTVLTLTAESCHRLQALIQQIGGETSSFRQRMLVGYLMSLIGEEAGEQPTDVARTPAYILQALAYIEEHYGEKIVAAALAHHLNVSRTTLMTEFKRHTDRTVVEYLTHCRIRHATRLLREGKTLEDVAAHCGFADSSGLVRCFKRCYGTTPRRYLAQGK